MRRKGLQDTINSMSITELMTVLDNYGAYHKIVVDDIKTKIVSKDIDDRLEINGINNTCPFCNCENVVKAGIRRNFQQFKCNDCGKRFTRTSHTILEKSRYSWEAWVKVMQMTLNNQPIKHIQETLEADYKLGWLNYKSVFDWKHKIINAISQLPMPTLSGVIQVDETFFREGQKGSRKLETTVKGEKRDARYGRRPSKYGVMGNEFANVVAMVDLSGHAVAKVVGLGKLTIDSFVDYFDEYIDNPSFLCSDGNSVYKKYSSLKNIPLYVKPSNYVRVIQKAGYETPDWSNPKTAKETEEKNNKILFNLYYEGSIDYINKRSILSYKDFFTIKNRYSLSLARVNQFHNELKRFIEYNTKGVSTKYLADYVGFQTFIRNWKIDNGRHPSSEKDAEQIFLMLLRNRIEFIERPPMTQIPKQSDKYMALLKKRTEQARTITKNPYFKYNEEDGVISFNTRKYIEDLPAYKFDALRRYYKIPKKWVKHAVISKLMQQPDIIEQVILIINEDKALQISEEDLAYIRDSAYRT